MTHTRHVLIVGWDGVRDDERRAARTPNLDAVAASGFATSVRVHEKNPTISGPVWTTVATGVYSDRHGVRDNDLRPYDPGAFPDVLTRVRQAVPGSTTFAAASWPPLVSEDSGGPVFGTGYLPTMRDDLDVEAAYMAVDDDAVARAVAELREGDHTAVFSYLGLVDEVGHHEGVTPRYREAIEWCDVHLGTLLEAIAQRPGRAQEDWLVVVTTDHGHRDEGNHGGDSDEERSAWLVAAGPGLDAASGESADHADITPSVLAFLGIPVVDGLEGRAWGSLGSS